jgi:hypothetical protein
MSGLWVGDWQAAVTAGHPADGCLSTKGRPVLWRLRDDTKKPLEIVLPKSQQNAPFWTPNLVYGKQTVFKHGCGTLSGSKTGEVFR